MQTLPSLEKLFEICEYFDITPAEFFSDNTDPYEKSEPEELYSAIDSNSPTLLTLLAKKLAGNNKKKQLNTISPTTHATRSIIPGYILSCYHCCIVGIDYIYPKFGETC